MNEKEVSIEVFKIMGSIHKDLGNITKTLIKYQKDNSHMPGVVVASVVGSLCLAFINVLHYSFWQEVLVKIAQDLAK